MSWWCSAKVESLRHWSDGWYHPPGVGNRWGVFTDEMRDSRVTGYLDLLREAMKRALIILVALIVIFPGWVESLQSIHVDSHVDWCRSHGENNHHFGLGFAEAQWNIEESMSHLPKVRMTWEMMIAALQIDYADCKTMGKFKALLAGLHSVYQAGKQLRDWTCKKAEQTSSLPVACYSSLPLQSASARSTYDGIMCPTRQSFFTW